MVVPTKTDHFGVFWGYHHLRKHPFKETRPPLRYFRRTKNVRNPTTPGWTPPNLEATWGWRGASWLNKWRAQVWGGWPAQLKRAKLYKNPFLMAENTWVTGKYLSNWIISSGRGENRKYLLVGGWVSPPLKNMQKSKWESSSRIFGVRIKNIWVATI